MKRILAITLAFLMVFQLQALCDENISVYVRLDAESETITVSGSGKGTINIIVLPESGDEALLSAANKPIDMLSSEGDGEYKCSFKLSDTLAGEKLKITAVSESGEKDKAYYVHPDFDVDISSLNSLSSASKLMSACESMAADLGIDAEDEFYTENKSEIYQILYSLNGSADSFSDFYDNFGEAYTYAMLGAANASEIGEVLKNRESFLGINYDDFKNDERLTQDIKNEVYELLSKADFKTEMKNEPNFELYFEKTKALAAILQAELWQDIQNVMENDFKDLFTLSDVSSAIAQSAYSAMMSGDYNSFSDIEKNYTEAIKAAKEESTPQRKPSAGGGGGSVSVPKDVEIEIKEEQSEASGEKTPMATISGEAESSFYDVSPEHWGYKAVSALCGAGIINGYSDNSFKPSNTITRAEYTKLICASFGIPTSGEEFSDVEDNAWYAPYIGGASKYALVSGVGSGCFSPNSYITREDAAVIAYRALKNEGIILNGGADFEDSMSISLYALTAVGAFKTNGILSGDGVNFYPKNNITRAEAAQLLYKVLSIGR